MLWKFVIFEFKLFANYVTTKPINECYPFAHISSGANDAS